MPSQYTVDDGFQVETHHFTRYHLSEVTGDLVLTKSQMSNDIVTLTHQQAQALVDKWNHHCEVSGFDYVYAVYDDVE
jgi:hypothetical protein